MAEAQEEQNSETPNNFKYVRKSENPGLLVVISNDNDTLDDPNVETFTNRPTGVKEDVRQLVTTFLDFGFDVLVKRNATKIEIMETMLSVARENNTKHECLVIAILTFGGKTRSKDTLLFDADGEIFDLEELVQPLRIEKFPDGFKKRQSSFLDKPKIVFVQACPGGILIENEEPGNLANLSGNRGEIPLGKDFLFYCSSAFEPYAWCTEYKGSIFIQKLCKMLRENNNVELINLLTWVNAEVSEEYEERRKNDQDHSDYPIPEIHSQLRASYKWAIKPGECFDSVMDGADSVVDSARMSGPQKVLSLIKRPFTPKRTSKLL